MRETILRKREDLCEELDNRGFEGVILSLGPDTGYFSGFQFGKQHYQVYLLISTEKEPVFIAPQMLEEQIEENSFVEDVLIWRSRGDILDKISSYFDQTNQGVLVDDYSYHIHGKNLEKELDIPNYSTEEILQDIKQIKFSEEIERLRKSAQITSQVFDEIRSKGDNIIGMTERELEDLIVKKFRNNGGREPAFSLTVAAGENGSKVLHEPESKIIERGEPVVIDIGTTYKNYLSDCARTMVFDGEPSEEFKQIYQIVKDSYERALTQIKPGNTLDSVASAARSLIESEGYGEYYITSGGHGLGRSTSEQPYIKVGNEKELEPGMVLTLEPGIYLPGEFGAKVENTILVTEDGYEILNETSEEWAI